MILALLILVYLEGFQFHGKIKADRIATVVNYIATRFICQEEDEAIMVRGGVYIKGRPGKLLARMNGHRLAVSFIVPALSEHCSD